MARAGQARQNNARSPRRRPAVHGKQKIVTKSCPAERGADYRHNIYIGQTRSACVADIRCLACFKGRSVLCPQIATGVEQCAFRKVVARHLRRTGVERRASDRALWY